MVNKKFAVEVNEERGVFHLIVILRASGYRIGYLGIPNDLVDNLDAVFGWGLSDITSYNIEK